MKKVKRAAVYDRWLNSLGGGEQVAFAYAIALRDFGYETELLTHSLLDVEAAEKKMNVDLSGINMRYIPFRPDYQLSGFTEEYDVFVCNSYLDYIPNRAKYGILSIFFPSKINLSTYEYLKIAYIVPSLRNFFIYPSTFEGFRYDEQAGRKILKYLGKNSTINFSDNLTTFSLVLHFGSMAFSCVDNISFSLDDELIKPAEHSLNVNKNTGTYTFKFRKLTRGKKFTIHMPESEYSESVSLIRIVIPSYRYIFYNIFKRFFPRFEMRLHGGPSLTKSSDIESYDKILTISQFSRRWVDMYWAKDSEVLYPPVSTRDFWPAQEKKNIIAHIGRFFVTGHSKKQLDLVRVFKQLVDDGFANWELHFIGSVADGEAHQQYLNQVREEARGYPVFFHINAPFTDLRETLSQAKIYWHATGLDENPDKFPIRLEHFGITTVEAMASGCVPVVINLGGQKEIVTKDSGYVWTKREELLSMTEELIQNPEKLKLMSENAIKRSKEFSFQNFKKELRKHLP